MREDKPLPLQQLDQELIKMGNLCEQAISSVAAIIGSNGPGELRDKVRLLEEDIDRKEREIESLCMQLFLAPGSPDLRAISAALKIITELERIGDKAADIAQTSSYVPAANFARVAYLSEMARANIEMVSEGIDAFVKGDLRLAREVIAYDDVVDGLFAQTKQNLAAIMQEDEEQWGLCLDLLIIAKDLERIGDHALSIAQWVDYAITGTERQPL